MEYTVKILSQGHGGEVEWEETITSDVSMTGARRKATNWIKRNLCLDGAAVEKKRAHPGVGREYWWIVPFNEKKDWRKQ